MQGETFGLIEMEAVRNNKIIVFIVILLTAVAVLTMILVVRKKIVPQGPNIIMISIDTLRRDHCSVYGYQYDTTPNLQAFAKQGTTFDLAYAPSSTTAISHATMFTGLYPISHGVFKNGIILDQKYTTLAEYLKSHNYQTAALVSVFVLESKFGFKQGFDYFYDTFKESEATIHSKQWGEHPLSDNAFDRRADYTTERAINWLTKKRSKKNPFFLFLHYFDPHRTYIPPEPFASQFSSKEDDPSELSKILAGYDGEVAFTDSQLGILFNKLDQMGLSANTIVVITSDHGEGLMQHNWLQHALNIYEEAVRVPFLIRWPGHIPQGKIVSEPVETICITPTLLDLIGIKADTKLFQGESLAPIFYDEAILDKDRPIYLYRQHYNAHEEGGDEGKSAVGVKIGIRVGSWKYIEGEEENTKELFDLSKDPGELTNLYAVFPDKAGELESQLKEWEKTCLKAKSEPGEISEQDIQRLRSLGYTN